MNAYLMRQLLSSENAQKLKERIESMTECFYQNNKEFDNFLTNYNTTAFETKLEEDGTIGLDHCIEDKEHELADIKQLMEKVVLLQQEIQTLYEKEKTEIEYIREAEKEICKPPLPCHTSIEEAKEQNKITFIDLLTGKKRTRSSSPLIKETEMIKGSGKSGLLFIPLQTVVKHKLNVLIPYFIYLQQWSGFSNVEVLYNSTVQTDDVGWFKRIQNKPNLYFINIDTNGSIFGGFTYKPAVQTNKYVIDPNHFLFSLKKKEAECCQVFKSKKPQGLILCEKSKIMYGFGLSESCLDVYYPNKKGSCCFNLSKNYVGLSNDGLNGFHHPNDFTTTRILVLQMSK